MIMEKDHRTMTTYACRFLLSLLLGTVFFNPAPADAVRIKDIGAIEGVRENQLIGYGLVVGLTARATWSSAASSRSKR